MASSTNATEPAAEVVTAKLFKNGRSQAVRLPKQFRFEGDSVRIRKTHEGVLLEPLKPAVTEAELDAWFAELRSYNRIAGEFMPEGRSQPPMPPPSDIFE